PCGLLLWNAFRARDWTGHEAQRLWLFVAGVLPFGAALAVLNTMLFESPLANGYRTYDTLYSLHNVAPNLARYPQWLVTAQTPLVIAALLAPCFIGRVRHRGADINRATIAMGGAIIVAVFACYVPYIPFDSVWYLRFLLPAFPFILVFVA